MKLVTTISISLFMTLCCHGQANTDSLWKVMKGNGSYQERIEAYLEFARYFTLKNFDTTINAGTEGLLLARKNGDSTRVAEFKSIIGVACYFKGDYALAAKNYYESIEILERTNEKAKLANGYNDIAKLYRKTRDLRRALENYDKAGALFRELKDTAGMAMILNESGVVFEYRGDYEEAIRRYTASRDLAEKLKDRLGISYALSNIAGVQVIQKKYDEAEKNLLQALDIRRLLGDSFAIALTFSDLGSAMSTKGDNAKAITYLEESNRIAEKLHYPELQANNYNEMAMVASRQNDYRKALEYYQKRTSLRDSIYTTEKTRQIQELDAKYQSIKKEQIIEQQHNRIVRQDFLFLGIAGLGLMIGLLTYSQYKRYRLRKEKQLQAAIMQQQEMAAKAVIEAEEEERQRIARDLHDGVGQMMSAAKMNLSAFESEINFSSEEERRSFEKIIHLVDESCKEVRHVSHNMMPNALMKNNLAMAIRDFIDKMDKRSLEIHLYTEGLDTRLDANVESVLYRVIQECVNNVVKHADASSLDISIVRDKEGISATIEDNGIGFDTTDKAAFGGMGLKNVFKRIGFLKGTVEFDSSPGRGTAISLHVPLPV